MSVTSLPETQAGFRPFCIKPPLSANIRAKPAAIHFRACLCTRVKIIRGVFRGSGQGKACLLAWRPQNGAEGVFAVRATDVMVNPAESQAHISYLILHTSYRQSLCRLRIKKCRHMGDLFQHFLFQPSVICTVLRSCTRRYWYRRW